MSDETPTGCRGARNESGRGLLNNRNQNTGNAQDVTCSPPTSPGRAHQAQWIASNVWYSYDLQKSIQSLPVNQTGCRMTSLQTGRFYTRTATRRDEFLDLQLEEGTENLVVLQDPLTASSLPESPPASQLFRNGES